MPLEWVCVETKLPGTVCPLRRNIPAPRRKVKRSEDMCQPNRESSASLARDSGGSLLSPSSSSMSRFPFYDRKSSMNCLASLLLRSVLLGLFPFQTPLSRQEIPYSGCSGIVAPNSMPMPFLWDLPFNRAGSEMGDGKREGPAGGFSRFSLGM